MASLQKFKLFATQCGVAPSPTRSPRTSPVVHLRRRKSTLLMFFSRSSRRSSPRRQDPPFRKKGLEGSLQKDQKEKGMVQKLPLKELFASPMTPSECSGESEEVKENNNIIVKENSDPYGSPTVPLGGSVPWRIGIGLARPARYSYRYRLLLRRNWRPVLVTIPE